VSPPTEPIELHCVGGFAVAMRYGLHRTTSDLDIFEAVPSSGLKVVLGLAGRGSALARKHRLHIDAGSRVATLPENYAERLEDLFPDAMRYLRLRIPDPYDLALSKLERNLGRDREDMLAIARAAPLEPVILRERYVSELRPFVVGPVSRHDGTMALWVEMLEEMRGSR
jgi:Nucleotidyltransferase of unknown function (DUF6036)